MKRPRRQRVVITLTDNDEGSFTASIEFEPSHKKIVGNSPAANAGLHLARIIVTAKDHLAQPLKIPNPTQKEP